MKAYGFQKNTVFSWGEHQYKIERVTPQKQVLLERNDDGYTTIVAHDELLAAYQQGQISFVNENVQTLEAKMFSRHISDMPVHIIEEVKRRKHYVDYLMASGRPVFDKAYIESVITEAANSIGDQSPPSMITLYRWYKKFIHTQDVRTLIPRFDRRGRNKMHESSYSQSLVVSTVQSAYQRSPQTTIKTIYNDYVNYLAIENQSRLPEQRLHMISERTFRRRLIDLGAYELVKLKEGKAAAERKYRQVLNNTVTHNILERVEVDHTSLDLFILDKATMQPMGRPTLTIMIDHYSRMVLGYYISFQGPSTTALIGALRHAISPKTKLSKVHPFIKVNNMWECYGVPTLIVADNGFEFHSQDFEAIALDLGIRIEYCPKRQAWYKGTVERFLKTLNYTFVSQLPGASYPKWHYRGDYDPLKHTLVDFQELQLLIEKWILDVYAQSYHSSLKTTPSAKWQEGLQRRQLTLPMHIDRLRAAIGKSETRALHNDGIVLGGIRYHSDELEKMVRRYKYKQGIKVRVVYDPEDMGQIQVFVPDTEQPIQVYAMDLEYAKGLTEIQNKVIQKSKRKKGKAQEDTRAVSQSKFEISQAVMQMQASKKLINNKRAAKLSGISSSKPESALLQSTHKITEIVHQKHPMPHASAPITPLPTLPKFELRKGE